MSITNKAVTAGVQSAASTAKGQATDHYSKEINTSPVSPLAKNMMHIGMQGAAAAGSVALTEAILKALENVQKSKPDGGKSDSSSDAAPKSLYKKKREKESLISKFLTQIMAPAAVGLALGASIPLAANALEKK